MTLKSARRALCSKEEQFQIDALVNQKEAIFAKMEELYEEHSGEEGLLAEVTDEKDKISKKAVQSRIRQLGKINDENKDELAILQTYFTLLDQEAELNTQIKTKLKLLEDNIIKKYPVLNENEIKILVVEDKWMAALEKDVKTGWSASANA